MTVVRVAEGGLVNRLVASSMGKRSRSAFSLALASVRLAHKYSVTGEWWAPASEEKVDRQGMISLVSGSRGNLLEVRRSSRSMVCARGVCAAVASIINCVDGLSNVGSSLPLLELFTSRRREAEDCCSNLEIKIGKERVHSKIKLACPLHATCNPVASQDQTGKIAQLTFFVFQNDQDIFFHVL